MKGFIVLACAAGLLIGCGVEGDGAGEGSPGPGSGSAADEFFDRIDQAIDTQCDEEGYGLEMAGTPCPDFNLFASDCQDGERLVRIFGDGPATLDHQLIAVGDPLPPNMTHLGEICAGPGSDVSSSSAFFAEGNFSRLHAQADGGGLEQARNDGKEWLSVICRPKDGTLHLWAALRSTKSDSGWMSSASCLFDPSLSRPPQE